jgi:hypothetical protein
MEEVKELKKREELERSWEARSQNKTHRRW